MLRGPTGVHLLVVALGNVVHKSQHHGQETPTVLNLASSCDGYEVLCFFHICTSSCSGCVSVQTSMKPIR